MVTSVIVTQPGGALARPKAKPAATGLALINKVLDDDAVRALVDADRFRREVQEAEGRYLEADQVKALHRTWLRDIVRAEAAYRFLLDVSCCWTGSARARLRLTQAEASAMLHYLFGAMGKRRNDEAAGKLLACADVFSPASNALGPALRMWEAAPTHPVFLAIAIKQLMAEKTFEPSEAELREALRKVKERLSVMGGWVERWREKLYEWDARIFERDRAAWDAADANVASDVVRQMRERLELMDQGPCEDEDGNQIPPSPCWLALNALCEAKQAEESAKLAAESEPRRLAAACKTPTAKKTRKLKQREGTE